MSNADVETGVGESIMIGLEDAAAGWHELVTGNRRQRLEQTCQRLRFMEQDIRDVQILHNLLTSEHNEVMRHLLLQAQQFKTIFNVEPTGEVLDWLVIGKRIALLTTSVTGTVATGSYAVIGVSRLWSMMGRVSTAPVSTVASAGEIEMVLIRGMGQLNAGVNVATVASEITETASTAVRVTNLIGKVAFYAGVLAAALQTVLQGIEVANIRNAQKEIEGNIATLGDLLKEIKTEFQTLVTSLKSTYETLTLVEDGKHVVRLPGAPDSTFFLEDFFSDIASLTDIISKQDSVDDKAFQEVRLRLMQNQSTLKTVLVPALTQSMTVLATLEDQVRTAFRALHRGMKMDIVADLVDLDAGTLDKIATYCSQHPDTATAPKLKMTQQGEIELIDA